MNITNVKRRRVKRRYDTTGRQQAAASTRASILAAARRTFIEQGYARTTMADIARAAEIALDTIYASIGKKQVLLQTLIEAAISGTDRAVPAEEREYVRAIHAEPDARRKLAIYARALRAIHERLTPLMRVLKEAATMDETLATLWKSIADRRASNMRRLAKELAATGQLRSDVDVDETADVIWATNAPEFYVLLVEDRGWSPAAFEAWLVRAWTRLLLRDDRTR
jgi:AcrR family transcriptional regulator